MYYSSECGIPDYDDGSFDEIETLTQTNKGNFYINLFSVKINRLILNSLSIKCYFVHCIMYIILYSSISTLFYNKLLIRLIRI